LSNGHPAGWADFLVRRPTLLAGRGLKRAWAADFRSCVMARISLG
jgi:hypothetical protein